VALDWNRLTHYVCQLLAVGYIVVKGRVRCNAGNLAEELETNHVHKIDSA
jgi:hypothetical protein